MSQSLSPACRVLDATGLKCPLPVIKTQKILREMKAGDILEVVATDPNAPSDFKDFCSITQAILLSMTEEAGFYRFVIQKKV